MDALCDDSGATPETKRIWRAVAAAIVLWALQEVFGWYIAAHTCPAPTGPLTFVKARVVIEVVTLLALGAAVIGMVTAGRLWCRMRAADHGGPIPASPERARFVAMLGLLTCITIALGIAMAGLPPLFVRTCGEMR
jgi:hypothetical protein